MAATITINGRLTFPDGLRARLITVAMDASYPTGGESVSASDCELGAITTIITGGPSGGYLPEWDGTASKMKAVDLTTGAEAGSGADLAACGFGCVAYGTAPTGG